MPVGTSGWWGNDMKWSMLGLRRWRWWSHETEVGFRVLVESPFSTIGLKTFSCLLWRHAVDQTGTRRDAVDEAGTRRDAVDEAGTCRDAVDEAGTRHDAVDEAGTCRDAVDQAGTRHIFDSSLNICMLYHTSTYVFDFLSEIYISN